MKIGFIGLGNLGKAMARRLSTEGVELVVWNRTREKAEGLSAEVAESPSSVMSRTSLVFLNLFDSTAVTEVLAGDRGLLNGDCRGKTIIDTTTNSVASVVSFHDRVTAEGCGYLEAPVLGSVVPASQGALTVLASGAQDVFDAMHSHLEKIGKSIFFLGVPGAATRMKLVNNMVLAAFMAAIGEAVAFAEQAGIDKALALEVLAAGAGDSVVLKGKKAKLMADDFSPQFSTRAILKDLRYLEDFARSLDRKLFAGALAKELFTMTESLGLADMDLSAVYRTMKDPSVVAR